MALAGRVRHSTRMIRFGWGAFAAVPLAIFVACSSAEEGAPSDTTNPDGSQPFTAGDSGAPVEEAATNTSTDDAGADAADPCAKCEAPAGTCSAGEATYYTTTCPDHVCTYVKGMSACAVACGKTSTGADTCVGTNARGAFDSADENGLHGWACDPDTPWAAGQVHAYFDGPAGAAGAKGIPGILATSTSEKAVNDLCGGGDHHRYNFTPSQAAASGIAPGVHSVWAYAISSGAGESNLTLNQNPLFMPMPATSVQATYVPNNEHKVWAKVGGQNGGGYAYAPTIMMYGGEYHLWACNFDGVHLGDSVGYSHSSDGANWATPTTVLYMPSVNQGSLEHTCDPSVVRFKPPGSNTTYFYLFYSSLLYGTGTINSVARSASIGGPFKHYMGGDPNNDSNWVQDPGSTHPFVIQKPNTPCGSTPNCYGLGEPSVVVRGDTLHMWYNLANDPDAKKVGVYHATSKDGITWLSPTHTNYPSQSVDVKWDPASQQYVMFGLQKDYSTAVEFQTKVSKDGNTWTALGTPVQIPDYSAEFGVSGDERGYLHGGKILFGFAAPYNLMGNTACVGGQCELFVSPLDVTWK